MSSTLESLPPELLLKITSYVSLQSLRSLRLSSRHLNDVFSNNEWTVYHNAALYHAYARPECMDLSDAKASNMRYPIKDPACDGWKDYCRRCFLLDRTWAGVGHSEPETKAYREDSQNIHRIKVDEELGLLFTSSRPGAKAAICVTDLKTGALLWKTPSDYVRAWAHVEYGRGFLVFDRISGQKEIWRLADDIDNSSVSASPPDTSQMEAFSVTSRHHGRSGRGRLRPWALLTMPEMTRACRFVYPTFLAASQNTAYLWDLPSARLVQTLHGFQAMHNDIEPLGDVRYVDVDARHVVLCGQNGIRVISREDSSVVLRLSNTGSSTMLMSPELTQGSDRIPLVSPLKTEHMRSRDGHPWGRFRAAHLSETGRDLACLLADGRLVLIRDFERAVSGNVPIADAALEVDLTHVRRSNQNLTYSLVARRNTRAGYYLAFEQGRVVVATSSGLYVVTLDASQRGLSIHGASAEDKSTVLQPPQSEDGISENTEIAVSWLPRISDAEVLQHISCLQLSATRLYITWQANRVDVIPNRHCNVTAQVWKDDPPYYEPDVKNVWTGRPMVHPRGPLRDPGFVVLCVDFGASAGGEVRY